MDDVDLVAVSRRYERILLVPPAIRVVGKAPIDPSWPTGPRRNPDNWRRKLAGWTGNIGIVTGNGEVVVDADTYKSGGEDSLDRLYELGLPRETPTILTGGGGRQLHYTCPVPIRSGELAGFPGIDIKADGGMVVVPPSVHASGRPYEEEFGWGLDDIERAVLPSALIELFGTGNGDRPHRDLDERDDEAVALLERLGGHDPRRRRGHFEITRPGKYEGISATVGVLGPGVAYVHSTGWDGLSAGVHDLADLRRLVGVPGPKFDIPKVELPEGFRLWTPGDDDFRPPVLGVDAYHGPIGDYLVLLDGRTEAHPAAIGFSVLTYLGCWIGRDVTFSAGPVIRHHPALWGAFVGPTSSGAKGISWSSARLLLDTLDARIVLAHTASGFGSGQALVAMLRDDDEHPNKAFVVHDHELASILRVGRQEGSILSETLRKAFDGEPLENRTRQHGELVATSYFVAALASITTTELRELLDTVSIENGLGNRFLWLWSELTATLPFGADVDVVALAGLADRIADNMSGAIAREYRIVDGTPAGDVWKAFYNERRRGVGLGSVKALTARHHVHAARLATVYAVLDGATAFAPEHVRAAIAWCDYSHATVEQIFGGLSGDAVKLLDAIRKAGGDGLTYTAQNNLFSRNLTAERLEALRAQLAQRHLIVTIDVPTGGRPSSTSYAVSAPLRTNERDES